jgi:cephalosporin-C deacetylase-like acetyl esterase
MTMKYKLLILALVLGYTQISAQNLLTPQWKFKTGDDVQWAKPETDDSEWKEIIGGIAWESQGYENYDGFAWYRKKVFIPSSLKKQATQQEGFILTLGRIDDADFTYLNGELLAKTGDLPPTYKIAYDKERKFVIPVSKIKWDADNLIAVRVYDGGGFGGMYTTNIALKIAGIEDFIIISPAFKESNRILLTHDPINLPVSLKNTSSGKLKGKLMVQVTTDFKEKIAERTVDNISISKKSTKIQNIALGKLPAGFYSVAVSFQGTEANAIKKFNFGVNPEEIISPPDRQNDFENYWERAKKELAAVNPQYKLIRIDSICTPDKEWYLLEMRSLGNVLIRGFYGKPVKPGKYPAILHVQGYGSTMIPQWGYQGNDMVSLALNIRGHGNSKDNIDPGFRGDPGYLLYQLHDKEMYIYRGAYMDCRRAVDFLFSRPEVDNTRIAVEGGSQGGALTFATAALNNDRITVAVPNVPFLSDFPDYFRCANWPGNEFASYVKDNPEIGWKKVYETLSYIDIKNLAPWIKCPVLMGVGLVDETCPPHINFAAYNQLSVPKEYIVYPESGHSIPAEFGDRRMEFIRKHFGMK